jgi:hypothetical protein
MNDSNLLQRLERVAAPPGFEDRVLDGLRARRAEMPRLRRARTLRLSLAGGSAFLLAGFAVLNLFILRGPGRGALDASLSASAAKAIAIDEPVDYRREVRDASNQAGTVYILEQVSDASNTRIKY